MNCHPSVAAKLMTEWADMRPSVGRLIVANGQVCRVNWHGPNRWARPRFYKTAEAEARGTVGYRVLAAPVDGSAPFFIDADKVSLAIHTR
ncbi:hypothetical protein B2_5 [Stenotrophomonas phage B2]|nr:hypothetical protein B2_5 [Stenotrophomonas phage B2]